MEMLKGCFRIMEKVRFSFVAVLMLASVSTISDANAGKWFHHSFGELRSYHIDWLNVCHSNGEGQCRTVQMPVDPERPFFGDRRLSVHRQDNGAYRIDIYQINMPTEPINPTIIIDRARFDLAPDQWTSGEHDSKNVAETITITDPELINTLLMVMRRGNRFTFTYGEDEPTRREAIFMLRGFTSATNAIERYLNNRDNE